MLPGLFGQRHVTLLEFGKQGDCRSGLQSAAVNRSMALRLSTRGDRVGWTEAPLKATIFQLTRFVSISWGIV
jgi:hypothetical protein